MRYTIYYRKNPDWFNIEDRSGGVVKIGNIPAFSLDEVFERFQNEFEESLAVALNIRSMGIGDIVVDQNQKAYICDFVGWREINFNGN